MADPIASWLMGVLNAKLITTRNGVFFIGLALICGVGFNLNSDPPKPFYAWDGVWGLVLAIGIMWVILSEWKKQADKTAQAVKEKTEKDEKEATAKRVAVRKSEIAYENVKRLERKEAQALMWWLGQNQRRFTAAQNAPVVLTLKNYYIIRETKDEEGLFTPNMFFIEPTIWERREEIIRGLVNQGYEQPRSDESTKANNWVV